MRSRLWDIEDGHDELSGIDDALDVLDDIGFYVHVGQLSPESAHHNFYHWIRGYYQTTRRYIRAQGKGQPKIWEYLPGLYKVTCQVERRCKGDVQSVSGLRQFLREEQSLLDENDRDLSDNS
jgi:hypothetical protein